MGYHTTKIVKGDYGTPSKIQEEFEEYWDALQQDNKILQLVELSDLIGAIEGVVNSFGLSLNDLIKMSNATKQAFQDGSRNAR